MTEDMNTSNDKRGETMPPPPRRRRTAWVILLLLIVVAAGSGVYFYSKRLSTGAAAATDATPAKSENTTPGMVMGGHAATQPSEAGSAPGQIYIAPERQQLIGVKTASAEMKSLVKEK